MKWNKVCIIFSQKIPSIALPGQEPWSRLPGSEHHGTVEVELQSTAVTIKCCQSYTALGTALTELSCGRPIIASI